MDGFWIAVPRGIDNIDVAGNGEYNIWVVDLVVEKEDTTYSTCLLNI